MGLVSDIRTGLSVVGVAFADGTYEYRVMTSAPDTNPRTYSAWTSLPNCRAYEFGESQVFDAESGLWFRLENCTLKIPYSVGVNLSIRHQIRIGGSTGQVWSVFRQSESAAGAVQSYILHVKTPMMVNPRRGGV